MSGPRVEIGGVTRTVYVGGQYVGVAQQRAGGGSWTFKLSGVAAEAVMLLNGSTYANLDKLTEAVTEAAA